jgi:hypothetical protein
MRYPPTARWPKWIKPIRAILTPLLLIPFFSGCSLLFANGPAPGWQNANAQDLETMALTQPCTNSKILPIIDGVLSGLNAVYGIAIFSDKRGFERNTDLNANFAGSMAFVWTGILGFSTHKGNNHANDCRAFGARLLEERRADTGAQATYNWLDEFSPVLDLGVASQDMPAITPPVWGFRSVFSGPISNSPEQ